MENQHPHAGIGYHEDKDSFQTGRQAALNACESMTGDKGGLALAFCTGKHDIQAFFNGIRSVLEDIPVIGGSALGIITNNDLGYDGYQGGVALLPDTYTYAVAYEGDLDRDVIGTGRRLGEKIARERNLDEKLVFLIYDSIKSPPPPTPVLNVSSYLLDGFEQGIGNAPPPIVGAGLIGDYVFSRVKQFCGDHIAEQHAVAVLFSGSCSFFSTIMHGCVPISDYHRITRVEGPVVFEIDGKPALDIIENLLGINDWDKRLPLLLVTMGVNYGAKYGPYDENTYVNRLIVGVKPEEKALVLFDADFQNGTEFQFMRRNAELMLASAEKQCHDALAHIRQRNMHPFCALYLDCAGRASGYSGGEHEEASIVQSIIGEHIPLFGFYTGVEIAPYLGKSRGLDWTGVLIILTGSSHS